MLMVMMHVECGDLRRIDENERRVALFEEKAAPLLSHELFSFLTVLAFFLFSSLSS